MRCKLTDREVPDILKPAGEQGPVAAVLSILGEAVLEQLEGYDLGEELAFHVLTLGIAVEREVETPCKFSVEVCGVA